jgi:hypothetical protein
VACCFYPTGRFLKKSNKFMAANYRRLLDLSRRPPPHIGIFTVNSPHNKTIKPNPSAFCQAKSQRKYFRLLTKSSVWPNILWQWFFISSAAGKVYL